MLQVPGVAAFAPGSFTDDPTSKLGFLQVTSATDEDNSRFCSSVKFASPAWVTEVNPDKVRLERKDDGFVVRTVKEPPGRRTLRASLRMLAGHSARNGGKTQARTWSRELLGWADEDNISEFSTATFPFSPTADCRGRKEATSSMKVKGLDRINGLGRGVNE